MQRQGKPERGGPSASGLVSPGLEGCVSQIDSTFPILSCYCRRCHPLRVCNSEVSPGPLSFSPHRPERWVHSSVCRSQMPLPLIPLASEAPKVTRKEAPATPQKKRKNSSLLSPFLSLFYTITTTTTTNTATITRPPLKDVTKLVSKNPSFDSSPVGGRVALTMAAEC